MAAGSATALVARLLSKLSAGKACANSAARVAASLAATCWWVASQVPASSSVAVAAKAASVSALRRAWAAALRMAAPFAAEHARLGSLVDERHRHIHDQHGKRHRVGEAAEHTDHHHQPAHQKAEDQPAQRRGAAADRVGNDKAGRQQGGAVEQME